MSSQPWYRRAPRAIAKTALPKERIAFIHLAKCGGTSFSDALRRKYRLWQYVSPHAIQELGEYQARGAAELAGIDDNKFRQAMFAYALSHPKGRLLLGHYHYSTQAHDQFRTKWRMITILRDPVERWLSHYYFNFNLPGKFNIDMPLEGFLNTERGRSLGALYVHHFAECPSGPLADQDQTVQRAIDVLKSFDAVGRLEDLSGLQNTMRDKFKLNLKVKKLNRGKQRPISVSPETRALVTECCQPDIQVYRELFG